MSAEHVYDITRPVEQAGGGRVPENELMRLQRECQQRPAADGTITIDRWQLHNIVHELRQARELMTWFGAASSAAIKTWEAYNAEREDARQEEAQLQLFERERQAAMYGKRLK